MIYISDTFYTMGTDDGLPRFHLWADEDGEAVPTLYAIGADPVTTRRPFNAWEAYGITIEQMALACTMGVLVTDKWGPLEWLARREGNTARLQMIAELRATR